MITPTGQNLVFLLSTPRAGSTLLSVLLDQFRGVACPPEPWFLLRLMALTEEGNPNARHDDRFATIATRDFLGTQVPLEAARAFAAACYNIKLAESGRTQFVDKTPRYFHLLPRLLELFPEAKFIWLKRNPLDVAASYKATWNLSPGDLFSGVARPETLDFAQGFGLLRDFFAATCPRDSQCVVGYEDLVANPAAVLGALRAFLGVQADHNLPGGRLDASVLGPFRAARVGDTKIHEATGIHAASIGRWRELLSTNEARQVAGVLGVRLFGELGYESTVNELVAGGWTPPAEEVALRHRAELCARWQEPAAVENERLRRTSGEQQALIEALRGELQRVDGQQSTAEIGRLARVCAEQQSLIEAQKVEMQRLLQRASDLEKSEGNYTRVITEQNSYIRHLRDQVSRLSSSQEKA